MSRILSTPCIESPGARNSAGYCNVKFNGVQMLAHRVAWIKAVGPIPDGLCCCHHCDNRGCINIYHLFLGTVADNNDDTLSKGRHVSPWKSGRQMDRELAVKILEDGALGMNGKELAIKHSVKRGAIYCLLTGKTWKHLERPQRPNIPYRFFEI